MGFIGTLFCSFLIISLCCVAFTGILILVENELSGRTKERYGNLFKCNLKLHVLSWCLTVLALAGSLFCILWRL